MSKFILLPIAALATFGSPLAASETPGETISEAVEIDFGGFQALTGEVASLRAHRLISLAQFQTMATEGDTLVLDTRSASAYERGHIAGAINLPFSDFTDEKLAEVIGTNKDRRILIYCNNNFSDNVAPVLLKRAPLALNIPTFINLVGYGYDNVWELGDTIALADVEWVAASE
jgi:hypothetical protein